MMSLCRFETNSAARYLETLCKHFRRKVEAEFDGTEGWVQFPFGRCEMRAKPHHCDMLASAEDARGLAKVVQVMTSHLERYAFRENPKLDWQTTPDRTARDAPTAKDRFR